MSSTRLFTMRLPEEDRALLEARAKALGLDMSKVLLGLIREGLTPGRVSIDIPEDTLKALEASASSSFRTVEGQILSFIEKGIEG